MLRLLWPKAIAMTVMLSGCASKFKRDITNNAPKGRAAALDHRAVNFLDAMSGEQVNLGAYMDVAKKDFLLVTFGSKGCGECNVKATKLTKTVIGKHPLYLKPEATTFEIIGVNTDNESYGQLARYYALFPFIRWSDPAGLNMIEHFLPKGTTFAVPLTAMISRRGIEWRILPGEQVSMSELMEKVAQTIGANAGAGDDDDDDGDDDDDNDDNDDVIVPPTDLALIAPGRLGKVTVRGCDRREANLEELFGDVDIKWLQVSRQCDEVCLANQRQLERIYEVCATDGIAGKSCKSASLVTTDKTLRDCRLGVQYYGGEEFFSVFKTHFHWSYRPIENPEPPYDLSLPEVSGPLVMAFDRAGRIVFSHEGALDKGELIEVMKRANFGDLALGPDFRFYDKATGEFAFSEKRLQAEYTIVMAWGAYPPCQSCIEELTHWSKEGGLIEYCENSDGFCQFFAEETHLPLPGDGQTLAQFYDGIIQGNDEFDGFQALGISAHLILDPNPIDGPNGDEYLDRFFSGYLQALRPDMGPVFRTVIYDREGKVIEVFPSMPGSEDPVYSYVKKLADRKQGSGG